MFDQKVIYNNMLILGIRWNIHDLLKLQETSFTMDRYNAIQLMLEEVQQLLANYPEV